LVREGIRGVLTPDEAGRAVGSVVCEPATNSYRHIALPSACEAFREGYERAE
jgi:hypothetical protein